MNLNIFRENLCIDCRKLQTMHKLKQILFFIDKANMESLYKVSPSGCLDISFFVLR